MAFFAFMVFTLLCCWCRCFEGYGITKNDTVLENDMVDLYAFLYQQQDNFEKGCQQDFTRSDHISILTKLAIPQHMFRAKTDRKCIKDYVICAICYWSVDLTMAYYSTFGKERLKKFLTFLCVMLRIEEEEVCRGFVSINTDVIAHILNKKKGLLAEEVCAIAMQDHGCFAEYKPKWLIHVPPLPNAYTEGIEVIDNEDNPYANTTRLIHLTDFHVDPKYMIGSNAKCKRPLCCQSDYECPQDPEDAAGTWGDYRWCDVPWHSLENALGDTLGHINSQPHVTYIYFTGDIVSHRVWGTSIRSNARVIKETFDLLENIYRPYNVVLFPIIGNHEPHPTNLFAPPSIKGDLSTDWLYEVMAYGASKWLPKQAVEEMKQRGYYTVLVKRNFRVIAMNNNVCYIYNWWIFYEQNSLILQLKWLVWVLEEAERNKEYVHILNHVPPGDSQCLHAFQIYYRKIVQRFSSTIQAEFNGHTHTDELKLFFDPSNREPINVAFNGGSITTYDVVNPNYKIFHMNTETYEMADFDSYMFDLDEANANPDENPTWYKLYSLKSAFGLNCIRPKCLLGLVLNMARNTTVLDKYIRYSLQEARPMMEQGCDKDCKKRYLCATVTTYSEDKRYCEALTNGLKPGAWR